MTTPARPAIEQASRIVIKVGTGVLTDPAAGLASQRLLRIVDSLATAHQAGREVILVSSGAVGLGRTQLGIDEPAGDLATRQACAAVGQGELLAHYSAAFGEHGVAVGQVLLTRSDFDDRLRYLHLRSTLTTLLRHRVIPIINENDAVATEELAFDEDAAVPVFGDNDGLSTLVATKLSADLLVLLTDVCGVYRRDPRKYPNEAPLGEWTEDEAQDIEVGQGASAMGRGGMGSKIRAARTAARSGCSVIIASGIDPQALPRVLSGADEGTFFAPAGGLDARDRWIACGAPVRGTLHLDPGAINALRHRGASLLAAGVDAVSGDFQAGDVVVLVDGGGSEVGRGIVHCDADTARDWSAGHRPSGVRNHDALVHRDHLVVL